MIKMWTVLCALIAVFSSTLMAKSSKLKKMVNDQYSSNYDLNPALLWRRAAQAERRESRFENLTSFSFSDQRCIQHKIRGIDMIFSFRRWKKTKSSIAFVIIQKGTA